MNAALSQARQSQRDQLINLALSRGISLETLSQTLSDASQSRFPHSATIQALQALIRHARLNP